MRKVQFREDKIGAPVADHQEAATPPASHTYSHAEYMQKWL